MSFLGDNGVPPSGRGRLAAMMLGACIAMGCTLSNPAPADTTRLATVENAAGAVATSTDYRRIESEVVRELDAARRDPSGYSRYLAELVPLYHGTVRRRPDSAVGLRTSEGASAVREAVDALRAQSAEPTLTFNPALSDAARDLAADQSRSGRVGHVGSDGSSPAIRLARHGRWTTSYAENVAYGAFTAGRDVVEELLIDDGVPDRGHRKNIFDPGARVVGVACAPHPKFGSVCVIDQAGGFTAR